MSIQFFSKFPTISYDLFDNGSTVTLTDIIRNVDVDDVSANSAAYYTYYEISDGERPDVVSQSLYGTPEYYWTFFIVNNEMRNGLNNGWPMSAIAFEKMMENEYDAYSSLSFKPIVNYSDIRANRGSFGSTPLSEKYLPYLRLSPANSPNITAKILKYDTDLLQLIIYDITGTSRTAFINNEKFVLSWVTPDGVEYDALLHEWVDIVYNFYMTEDVLSNEGKTSTLNIQSCLNPDDSINTVAYENLKHDWVFALSYVTIPGKYKWELYRNAAIQYYKSNITNTELLPVSAYEVMSNPAIVSSPFVSRYEKELLDDSKKAKIKIIRPDKIKDFVNTYYKTLKS